MYLQDPATRPPSVDRGLRSPINILIVHASVSPWCAPLYDVRDETTYTKVGSKATNNADGGVSDEPNPTIPHQIRT